MTLFTPLEQAAFWTGIVLWLIAQVQKIWINHKVSSGMMTAEEAVEKAFGRIFK